MEEAVSSSPPRERAAPTPAGKAGGEKRRRLHGKPSSDQPRAVILDGGMGHELKARIKPKPGQEDKFFLAGNLANVSEPEEVVRLHLEYLRAGADVLTTNNFVSVPSVLRRFGLNDKFEELTKAAGVCARKAVAAYQKEEIGRGREIRVAASLPPLTDCYISELVTSKVQELEAEYLEIAKCLESVCDLFLCETVSCVREAVAALRAVQQLGRSTCSSSAKKPVWISWTLCDDSSARLRSGELLAEAIAQVLEQDDGRLEAVLLNCCVPQAIEAALPALQAALPSSIAIGAYANAFQVSTSSWLASESGNEYKKFCRDGREDTGNVIACSEIPKLTVDVEYDRLGIMMPDAFASHSLNLHRLGAHILGGCCGTTPSHTAHVRMAVLGESRTSTLQ